MRRPTLASILQLPHMIRFRLTLWYTGLAALVLAAFVGSVFFAFSHYQFDNLDDQAVAAVRKAVTEYVGVAYLNSCPAHVHYKEGCFGFVPAVKDPAALNQPDLPIRLFSMSGQPLPVTDNTYQAHTPPPPGKPFNSNPAKQAVQAATKNDAKVSNNNNQYHFVTIPLTTTDGERVIAQVAQPLFKVQDQVDTLKRILIYVAGVLLLISAGGGWILAGRAMKPIDEITKRARQITAHDLSQRLNMDQEDELGRMASTFDDMIARLEEAFERQKRFTSDASHELRTPLTVMQADIGLALARPRTADEYYQTLVSVDEEVTRLSTIVNDLLMLTRIDVDPAGMQHQPVALHELLAGLSKRVRIIAADRDIAVHADHLEPVTVIGDATRLRQLFTNLLDNAVTYTRPGGSVTVRLERTREGARIQVSDTGIGIAAEHLPRIFERFYRTDQAREENARGTGLGLAISRSVVQAHHGEIAVQSTPDQGTTFTVTLPTDGRRRARRVHGLRALVPSAVSAR